MQFSLKKSDKVYMEKNNSTLSGDPFSINTGTGVPGLDVRIGGFLNTNNLCTSEKINKAVD